MITVYFLSAFTGAVPATSDGVPLGLLTVALVAALIIFVGLSLYKAFFAPRIIKPRDVQNSQQGEHHEG